MSTRISGATLMRKVLVLLALALRIAWVSPVLLVFCSGTPVQAQWVPTIPADTTGDDTDETPSLPPTMINQVMPMSTAQAIDAWNWGSDMDYASQHDARWAVAGASHVSGATSRIGSLFARGNTFYMKTGDTFGKILQAYADAMQFVALYNQMEMAWSFLKDYHLTVNLYKFLPLIDIMAPDEMGGGEAFAVGLLPKDSSGWQARANLLKDNIWYRPPGGLRLVQVRYPTSLNELTLNSSVWGSDAIAEEDFQKMLLSGVYDGVVSSSQWMTNAGIKNNMASNFANMGPKAFAKRKSLLIANRIQALLDRKNLLNNVANGLMEMPVGLNPTEVITQLNLIDPEIARLQAMDTTGYANSIMSEQTWMRKASFVNEILAKLEQSDRRLALMKLNERFRKYERFWADPSQMDPTPDITGNAQVDNAIYIIWQSLTLISQGSIPPPTPVPGGPAAEAQSTMVRSMYREFLVDELRAVRRLLAFRYVSDKQAEGSDHVVADGQKEITQMMAKLDAHAARITQLRLLADSRKAVLDGGGGWALGLPMTAN